MAHLTVGDLGFTQDDEEALDVLDLPQLYTKPSAKALLSVLADLSSEPPSWESTPKSGTPRSGTPRSPLSGTSTPLRPKKKVKSQGLPLYLTKIISSPLSWIESEEERELIWENASQRLSERSGRAAMGAISRTFAIPLATHIKAQEEEYQGLQSFSGDDCIHFTLHEPALTADNFGLKTWASSYLLAKRLSLLKMTLPSLSRSATILELGAGTGLVGLTAAAIFAKDVILTDLPEIVPNLERNVRSNEAVLDAHGAKAIAAVLDWITPSEFHVEGIAHRNGFPLILAADPVYSAEHPALLVQAINHHLEHNNNARVVLEIPLRDAYLAERQDLLVRMAAADLHVVEQGEETGFDDWASGKDEDELVEVRCWWTVWARTSGAGATI